MVAIAHVRGGDDKGIAWHEAGKGANKINTFRDFIAVAHWLIEEGYSSPQQLCSMGGSFGGALVLGAAAMAPHLFRAAIAMNPLTDMARYQSLNPLNGWEDEFGDVQHDEDAMHAIAQWSPLHNLPSGGYFPDTLIIAGTNDQTVSNVHSYKMIEALRRAAPKGRYLFYENEGAGHGSMNAGEMALIQVFATTAIAGDAGCVCFSIRKMCERLEP